MKHLWDTNHPYYMTEGNYYSNDCHLEYKSWSEFLANWGDSDMDYNWFVRWDWREGDDWGLGDYNGDDNYRHAQFVMQVVLQRKAKLQSVSISVCRNDESEILKFLEPRWDYMKTMWSPVAGDA